MAASAVFDCTLSGDTTGAIGHFTRLEWDGPNAGIIDGTDSSSTNNWREKIAGLKDAGRITVDLMFDDTLWDTIETNFATTPETWTLTFPDTSTLVVDGFIASGPGGGGALEDPVAGSITIELTGAPAFTAAA